MDSELLCPNCGYQVKVDDYYCPSCKHRIEFPSTPEERVVENEPVTEMVQVTKALVISSLIYLVSAVLSSVQSGIQLYNYNYEPTLQSIMVMASIGMASVSAFYLGGASLTPSRRIKRLHYPSLLTIILGMANLLLVIGLASIFPFPSTLNNIVNSLGNSNSVLQIAAQYSVFLALAGTAGFLGIFGLIGLLIYLKRSSLILRQKLIYYGMVAGILCTVLELFSGLSVFLILPPVLIIIGARKSLILNFSEN